MDGYVRSVSVNVDVSKRLVCCVSSKSKTSLPAEKDYKKNPMVTFKIADDDEDEGTADTQLLPQSTATNTDSSFV